MREQRLHIRVTDAERSDLDVLAEQYRNTVSGVIRRAIRSLKSQRPVLSPVELEALHQARELFRKAGQNLDSLLRQVYLHQNGVTPRGPELEEFQVMLQELRQAAAHYDEKLKNLP